MPSIASNLAAWNGGGHVWEADGDEFHQFATTRGQNYELWKQSLVDTFLTPNLNPDISVLEIGCGHGRWSQYFVGNVGKLWLLDLSPTCIEICQRKFGDEAATYILTGNDLSSIPDQSLDLIWSFDVFVHIDANDTMVYLQQLQRVMKPNALAIIHHADDPKHEGWRAQDMSASNMRNVVEQCGLVTLFQTDSWGPGREYSVKAHRDIISFIATPATQRCMTPFWL